jgi:hypothetical protein
VLLQHPDDLETRVNIAWCLLTRALYQAGIEAWGDSASDSRSSIRFVSMDKLGGAARSSRSLLNECLRHTSIVKQLSQEAEIQRQLSSMQGLIGLLGCSDQILMAEAQVSHVLDRIAGDLAQ